MNEQGLDGISPLPATLAALSLIPGLGELE